MKKVVIISPQFPPSNLAAVHRSRLIAKHLPSFGWEPIILTVHHAFYEEELDWNLHMILPASLRVVSSGAFPVLPFRLVGDIGIRGFLFLLKDLLRLVKKENVDFIYIPIPSFYTALLGKIVHKLTKVPFGIDYIDPWVHHFPGSEKKFSRHWFSSQLAKFLEPIAVKEASLITGVAEGYYKPVFERNPGLKNKTLNVAMPYGGEKEDHKEVKKLQLKPYLFQKKEDKFTFLYAGAMLPKAYGPLEKIFKVVKENNFFFCRYEFHFVGTGKTPNDPEGYNIKPLAEKYGLWNSVVFEYPKRIPYLDVLVHLDAVDGVFVLGSTEPHYTPSKVYQGILSEKPVFAVLHQESSAGKVVRDSKAGVVLPFAGESDIDRIENAFIPKLEEFLDFVQVFDPAKVEHKEFEKFSAFNVTKVLAKYLDLVVQNGGRNVG